MGMGSLSSRKLIFGILTVFILVSACFESTKFEATQIDKLVLQMENKYFRNIDRQPFSLHYRSAKPETIIIEVRHYPDANLNVITTLVESSKETINRLTSESFHFNNLEIRVDMQTIAKPTLEEIANQKTPELPPIMEPKKQPSKN